MRKTGVLLHVYNLDAANWEHIVWGKPDADQLGCMPKLCQLLLTENLEAPIERIVIFSGPSSKGGLREGEYTKKFLLDNLRRITDFPSIKQLAEEMPERFARLPSRIEKIATDGDLQRTSDEVARAVQAFPYPEFHHVIQVACASHAPRCMQLQSFARAEGHIASGQLWSVVASATFFPGTEPYDTVIFEKPHLDYDPMHGFAPHAPEVLRRYFALSPEEKRMFLQQSQRFMDDHGPAV